jgi:hypothetical protein
VREDAEKCAVAVKASWVAEETGKSADAADCVELRNGHWDSPWPALLAAGPVAWDRARKGVQLHVAQLVESVAHAEGVEPVVTLAEDSRAELGVHPAPGSVVA